MEPSEGDGKPLWKVLNGEAKAGRDYLIEHAGSLAVRKGKWKYIAPGHGKAYAKLTNTELGNAPHPQLYDLSNDPGETKNLANDFPEVLNALSDILNRERNKLPQLD